MNIILFGPPGSGKGTQGEQLAQRLRLPLLTMSRAIRAAIQAGALSHDMLKRMNEGLLLPDSEVWQCLSRVIEGPDYHKGVILDGYPRTIAQANSMIDHSFKLDHVVFLDVSDALLVERLSGRRVEPYSGRVYQLTTNPPKQPGIDDVSGLPLIQRDDDKPEVVSRRLVVYRKESKPLIAWFEEKQATKQIGAVHMIDASGDIGMVHQAIMDAIHKNSTHRSV
ncbi:MAG: nucleoside monophosphate kinase [Pseudomonadota bacterium]|nr:nucleoside monophosphate kinase [Pseudomonadota bacterium]